MTFSGISTLWGSLADYEFSNIAEEHNRLFLFTGYPGNIRRR